MNVFNLYIYIYIYKLTKVIIILMVPFEEKID